MKINEKLNLNGYTDERTRTTLFPTRVVLTSGDVINAEKLTIKKVPQVGLYDGNIDCCTLVNHGSETKSGVLVDFGREYHGTLNIAVIGAPSYAQLRIRLGESVSECMNDIRGAKNATNDHATRDMVMTVGPWSANETDESGFRFAYVELLTPDASIQIRSLGCVFIYRDIEYKGRFESSDPLVNKIFDTSSYTVHLNMQRYLWDGIKRDRLVWAGDMNTEVATILAVFGENEVVPKSLDYVKSITKPSDSMNGLSTYNLWWMLCHYQWYMGTGNYAYLAAQKDYIKEMLERYFGYIDENGNENLPARFVDHRVNTDSNACHCGCQGILSYAMRRAGDIFSVLGDSEFAARCYSAHETLKKQNPDPKGWKQAGAMLVLGDNCGAEEMYDKCISVGGAKGFSTFLGFYTLDAIGRAGKYSDAIRLMKDYWGGMLDMGATTFWEDFDVEWLENAAGITEPVPEGKRDIHGDNGYACYIGLRHSLCHGWASGPAPYLSNHVLGITPLEAGYRTVKFDPHIDGLDYVNGAVPTPYGNIEVEINKSGAKISAPDMIKVIK